MIPPEITPPSPSPARSTPSLAYTPPSDGDERRTVGAKITYWLRWLAVIPGALLAGILSKFLLHLALYYMFTEATDPPYYPELPEQILTPGVMVGTLLW